MKITTIYYYKGPATKLSNGVNDVIYTLISKDITFALAIRGKSSQCNRDFFRTEHPKLLIFEKTTGMNSFYFNNDIIKNKYEVNLDINTYVNTKMVYMERWSKEQLNNLYLEILTEKCHIERKTIQNSLSIATISPDEFAYNIMKKPGYIAKLAGEVVHLIKCIPKEVKLLHLQECYNELPVTTKNETWFLTPKTRILIRKGTRINCNSITPSYYKINNDWIKLTPTPTKAIPPNTIHPNTNIAWTYKTMESLATSGVYTQNELDKLQQNLMFPLERSAVLNTVAREIIGEQDTSENLGLIFTEATLKHIAENTWMMIWQKLTACGSISSVIIMIMIGLHLLKLAVDTIIRGYTLHAMYGWSIHLFAALFGSITYLFTTLAKQEKQSIIKPEIELQEIKVMKSIPSRPLPPLPHTRPPPYPKIPPSIQHKSNEPINTQMAEKNNNNHNIFSLNI